MQFVNRSQIYRSYIIGICTAVLILPSLSAYGQEKNLLQLMQTCDVVDLSLTIREDYPCFWPDNVHFQRWTFSWYEPVKGVHDGNSKPSKGAYYAQAYVMDGHTGTQVDFPPHFIPPPGSGLPFAGEAGTMTGEKYPLKNLMGPAAVVDVRDILDKSAPGTSPNITVKMMKEWENKHGKLKKGEVVIFYSGYVEKYYLPFPEGDRMAVKPFKEKSTPGWPAPTPELMEYLYQSGVMHVGLDSPSMGAVEGGQASHVAGLKHGMSYTEMLVNLGELPPRGAFFMSLPLKIIDQGAADCRSMAFKPKGSKAIGK